MPQEQRERQGNPAGPRRWGGGRSEKGKRFWKPATASLPLPWEALRPLPLSLLARWLGGARSGGGLVSFP